MTGLERSRSRYPCIMQRSMFVFQAPSTLAVGNDWFAENSVEVEERYTEHGAVLFRGFDVRSCERFREILDRVGARLEAYADPHTPRAQLAEMIYTSSEYSPALTIPFHSENSKNTRWPKTLWFCASEVPSNGGQTLVADNALVYRSLAQDLSPELLRHFEKHGVRYKRNYGFGVGLAWQRVFPGLAREQVVDEAARLGQAAEWVSPSHLRVSHVAPAILRNQLQVFWFNQAHLFHPRALEPEIRCSQERTLGVENLPSDAEFGYGEPIPSDVIDVVLAAYRRHSVALNWRLGDLVMLDNQRFAHGRAAYGGRRRVLVAMGELARATAV